MTDALRHIEASLGEGGVLGVAARFGNETVLYNADTLFPTASCIKIAIVDTLFAQAAAGTIALAQRVTVAAEDFVGGSGVLSTLTPGETYALGDLATLAITVSDNTASNLCLRAVGGSEAVNRRMRDAWNVTATTIHRPIKFQLTADDPPHTATGTPRDFLSMLGQLRPETLDRMRQVPDTTMLPRLLEVNPYADDLRVSRPLFSVAHKPGAVTGVRNDVGIIERDGQSLRLAVFTMGCPDPRWTVDNAGCIAVAAAAKALADAFFARD